MLKDKLLLHIHQLRQFNRFFVRSLYCTFSRPLRAEHYKPVLFWESALSFHLFLQRFTKYSIPLKLWNTDIIFIPVPDACLYKSSVESSDSLFWSVAYIIQVFYIRGYFGNTETMHSHRSHHAQPNPQQ